LSEDWDLVEGKLVKGKLSGQAILKDKSGLIIKGNFSNN